jgi:prepilin-type N-terminal cleavage/methylation domain-containing protein
MKRPLNKKGFTLFELLIGLVMISMVFAGSISLYLSSLKFLKRSQATDVTTNPAVSVENLTTPIGLANEAWVNGIAGPAGPGLTLDLRADYPVCGDFTAPIPNSAANFADDNYWHYGFVGTGLYTICDSNPNTVVTAVGSTLLIPNVDVASSTFEIVNPSGSGASTVVAIHLVTTTPAATLETNVVLSGRAKN